MKFLIVIVFLAGYTFKGNEAVVIAKFKQSIATILGATEEKQDFIIEEDETPGDDSINSESNNESHNELSCN